MSDILHADAVVLGVRMKEMYRNGYFVCTAMVIRCIGIRSYLLLTCYPSELSAGKACDQQRHSQN